MEELVLDVLSALADLDFVHDVGDGLHCVCHVAVAELFLGGDELDAHPGEDAFGDGGVGLVSEDAGAHVDDDVPHFGVLFDVAQKLAEHGSFGDGLCRVARLEELFRDGGFQAFATFGAEFALGSDRVAIGVDIDGGVHLTLGADAEVQDGVPACCAYRGRCGAVEAEELLPARE
uniref:hypothetical protein n=1 Tax=Microbacterium sp. CFBP 8801 TaxID=2774036 RepID=UPI001FCE8771|nr:MULTISPECIES: hypothetical protein [unclassified Microbacterium]